MKKVGYCGLTGVLRLMSLQVSWYFAFGVQYCLLLQMSMI